MLVYTGKVGLNKWWDNNITFNIRKEDHIHELILFGFLGTHDDSIAINYCILYAKHYIYLEKLNDKTRKLDFNVDFLLYLCYLKRTLKIEQNICYKKYQIVKFDKCKVMFETL